MNTDNNKEFRDCPLIPEITELTVLTKVLIERIDTLVSLHRDVIKWLLIVVCVIALGRSGIDLAKNLFNGTHTAAIAEEGRK